MIFWVQFWKCLQSVLCCNDLRSFYWIFSPVLKMLTISTSLQTLRSLSWILSPFLKRRAIQYRAAKIWEVSHYFYVQFWKYLQSVICCCEDLNSLSWVFESSSKNACNQYFAASIWEFFHDFFASSSETARDQYFAATMWEVSHDFLSPVLKMHAISTTL